MVGEGFLKGDLSLERWKRGRRHWGGLALPLSPVPRKAQSWWAAGSHRDHTQNILAWADRVVGPQESLIALVQLLLIGLFLISGSCKKKASVSPDHPFFLKLFVTHRCRKYTNHR